MKNSYKFLFFYTLILGTLITISANSWFSIWMGLEINLLSFIPLMMSTKNLFSSESSLKYFLVQALASSILLFAIIMFFVFLNLKFNFYNYMMPFMASTLLLKSGTAPFHFWFPSVMEGLNWYSSMIIMTWQKIAPLMILSYCLSTKMLIFIIMFSMVFGSLGGLNQTSLRKLMAFSSINHLGWMMASLMFNETLWMTYFLFYIFLNLSITHMFNIFKLFNINQTFKMMNLNLFLKLSLFIMLLSLGGLPPFLGFFPKWIIIEMMISKMMFFTLIIMLFLTLLTLYFYLRISYAALLINHLNTSWNFKTNYYYKSMKMLIFFSFISLWGLLLINYFYLFI